MMSGKRLFEFLSAAVASYAPNFEFPAGGENQEIKRAELASLIAIRDALPVSRFVVDGVRQNITMQLAYDIAIFGVRSAIHAVRTNSPRFVQVGVLCLALDDQTLDWRDVLTALALVERCAREAGVDFDDLVRRTAQVATDGRQALFFDYLEREPVMRTPEVMGYNAMNDGGGLRFVKRVL